MSRAGQVCLAGLQTGRAPRQLRLRWRLAVWILGVKCVAGTAARGYRSRPHHTLSQIMNIDARAGVGSPEFR